MLDCSLATDDGGAMSTRITSRTKLCSRWDVRAVTPPTCTRQQECTRQPAEHCCSRLQHWHQGSTHKFGQDLPGSCPEAATYAGIYCHALYDQYLNEQCWEELIPGNQSTPPQSSPPAPLLPWFLILFGPISTLPDTDWRGNKH
jgi:hypothetical protein